jgi:hypothetical protein
MKQTKILQRGFAILLTSATVALSGAVSLSYGQTEDGTKAVSSRSSRVGRDPFKKYEPPRIVVKKNGLITPPSIQERIERYKAQKMAAMRARVAAPKPTTAFLLSEVQVVGISRSPRGYAAIVEASPIKLAYVIYPGERFFDGQLVAIEDNRLVFRREVVFANGKLERSVEMKSLRQPSTVDALAAVAAKATPSAAPDEESQKKSENPPADKP